MTTHSHSNDDPVETVSLSNGYWFHFEVEGSQIAVFGSAWSGRETVFVNDEVVSTRRNLFSFEGRHQISINDQHYTVIFRMENILTGEVACKLCQGKRGEVLDEQRKGYITGISYKSFFTKLCLYLLAGYGAGNLAAELIHLLVDK